MAGSLFERRLASQPIAWLPWGDATGADAVAADRPVLLFCGCALDHWTALLADELHGDADACALVAECFTPVAVDVAGQRALAARVQRCLAATADAAGWPALAVALPDGRLFGATPWRPVRDRGGRAGVARVLLAVAQRWSQARADCEADAGRFAEIETAVAQALATADPRPLQSVLILDRAEAAAFAIADPVNGGFGPAPRGLDAGLLRFLVARCALPSAPPALAAQVERTLMALIAGGVHDHLAGGFHRGSTDVAWTLPFFEKRLIDQAQVATVLIAAAGVFGRRLYRDVAERALGWTVACLRRADGRYAAGMHADSVASDGALREGAAYTWTIEELAAVLGADGAALVAQRFGVGDPAQVVPGSGRSVLAIRGEIDADGQRRLPALIQRLAVARAERAAPACDDSVHADHQAALLHALTLAGVLPDADPGLRQAADDLAGVLRSLRSADASPDPDGQPPTIADLLDDADGASPLADCAIAALRQQPSGAGAAALHADRLITYGGPLLRRAPLSALGLCRLLHQRTQPDPSTLR